MGVQDAESKKNCDAREMSDKQCCASELKGNIVRVSSFNGAKADSLFSLDDLLGYTLIFFDIRNPEGRMSVYVPPYQSITRKSERDAV